MKILGWYSFIVLNSITGICVKHYYNNKKKSNLGAIILVTPIMAYIIYTLMKI